jgi:hypothetical protein
VMNNIIRVMKGMVWILQNEDTDLDETSKVHAKVLSQEIEKIQLAMEKLLSRARVQSKVYGKISNLRKGF